MRVDEHHLQAAGLPDLVEEDSIDPSGFHRHGREAQPYATLGAYLALSGNVVNTVIARAAYAAEIQATQDLIEIETQQLKITWTQADAGTVPSRAC
jgi:hypothetical protein